MYHIFRSKQQVFNFLFYLNISKKAYGYYLPVLNHLYIFIPEHPTDAITLPKSHWPTKDLQVRHSNPNDGLQAQLDLTSMQLTRKKYQPEEKL
jgi:hypothetical protein